MGVIYSVTCKTCKVTRDLDKMKHDGSWVENRKDALEYSDELEKEINNVSFRVGLLVSFMAKHAGHDCVYFSEFNEECEEKYNPYYGKNGFKEDGDFWID
jgi:hypothetical protein